MLDTALQTSFVGTGKQDKLGFVSVAKDYKKGKAITGLNLYTTTDGNTYLQIEAMEPVPFSTALPEEDTVLFSRFGYQPAQPDGELVAATCTYKSSDLLVAIDSERIAFYYKRVVVEKITKAE